MKDIDKIILNTLNLINYDRSKHITEQIGFDNKKNFTADPRYESEYYIVYPDKLPKSELF